MIALLDAVLLGLTVVVAVPVSVFVAQVMLGSLTRRTRAAVETKQRRPRIAVLIPAHNEAAGIVRPLEALTAQLAPGDRIVVVADNCSDDTAAVAGRYAQVVERQDRVRRGKGYALDFGVRHLAADPPEVVVIVDADCEVEAGTLDRIAHLAVATDRPVQALYLMDAPPSAPTSMRVAQFAWLVKNLVRPLGNLAAGLPCQLMGTGMAFTWATISRAHLASGHIVEDLHLGLELAAQRQPPLFCPEARVTSVFPANDEGTQSQRTRWEHGHLATIVSEAPSYGLRALRDGNVPLLALVADLCVPPLALLTLIVVGLVAAALVLYLATGAATAAVAASIVLAALSVSVVLAWLRFGRHILSARDFAAVPFYALRKIPLYLRFVVKRQVEWVRSKRD